MQLIKRRRFSSIIQSNNNDLVLFRRKHHEPESRYKTSHNFYRSDLKQKPIKVDWFNFQVPMKSLIIGTRIDGENSWWVLEFFIREFPFWRRNWFRVDYSKRIKRRRRQQLFYAVNASKDKILFILMNKVFNYSLNFIVLTKKKGWRNFCEIKNTIRNLFLIINIKFIGSILNVVLTGDYNSYF